MNKTTLSVILLFVVAYSSQSDDAGKSPQAKVSAEEYAVYSFLLSTENYDRKPVKLFVIEDITKGPSPDRDRCAPEKMLETETSAHLISPDFRSAVDDYKIKNAQAHRLDRSFKMRASYQLVSREGVDSIFSGRSDGWDKFYKKYPRSPGYIQ
jgi:hypothetical protein